jgi:hypothetical protein
MRTGLQELRREHQMPSYILFMDLIKAFDTTNHDLLFTLLLRYRAPTERVEVIRRLHTYFKLKFTLESLEAIIDYYVSVCQGDNMAPVPFLFQLSVSLFLVPRRYLDGAGWCCGQQGAARAGGLAGSGWSGRGCMDLQTPSLAKVVGPC